MFFVSYIVLMLLFVFICVKMALEFLDLFLGPLG